MFLFCLLLVAVAVVPAYAEVPVYTSIMTDGVKSYFTGMSTDVSFAGSSVLSVVLIIAAIGFIVATVARR